MRLHRGLIPCLLTLALTGCASAWVSHNERIAPRLAELRAGQSEQALKSWQAKADTDPVFALETGELARENRDFQASLEAWRPLDQAVSAPPISAQQWADNFAAVLVNDRVRHYEPPPFEQVLLKTRIALNYLAQGDWDNARVAIRQAHELEARLKIEQEKRQQEIETRAKEKQAPGMKDLGGYPVEVINAPEVLALKNGYQSAISHYLAGFVYEALGETSLAAAGYRQAIELQPDQPELDAALAGLDSRRQQRRGQRRVPCHGARASGTGGQPAGSPRAAGVHHGQPGDVRGAVAGSQSLRRAVFRHGRGGEPCHGLYAGKGRGACE